MARSCLVQEMLKLLLEPIHFAARANGCIAFPLTGNLTRGCARCPVLFLSESGLADFDEKKKKKYRI